MLDTRASGCRTAARRVQSPSYDRTDHVSNATLSRRAPLYAEPDRGQPGFQVARSLSLPISHSFGCASTRFMNALPCFTRAVILRRIDRRRDLSSELG